MSPKVIASCGRACAQALVNESRGIFRLLLDVPARTWAAVLASSIRCTQHVHFSILPPIRAFPSGIFRKFAVVFVEWFCAGVIAIDPQPVHHTSMRDL